MPPNGHHPAPAGPPTRVRYSILALLCALAMITYLDRAANGSGKKAIMADLNAGGSAYTDDDFFLVLMAFQIAYAVFEIPSGWLGDTRGPRSTLLRVVLWWSAFVALTGLVGLTVPVWGYVGFGALLVIQFLFGVGEAGAFPNIAKALYNWFPADQRGAAKSAVWMSARFMGGLTPLVWLLMVGFGGLTWRDALWCFAGAAAVWCGVFAWWFRNTPGEHPAANPAEAELAAGGKGGTTYARSIPWGTLARSRNLWALCGMYVATNFNWYFLMYYLPDALKGQFPAWNESARGKVLLALLAGSPLLVGMVGCFLGGVLSDRYIRRTGDRAWGRRWVGMAGYGLAGLFYLAAAGVKLADPDNLWAFAGCLMLVGFCNDLIMAPAWATAQDVGRRYAATVSGAMNMVGNLAGAVTGILVTGLILKRFGAADGTLICFAVYGVIYWVGVLFWRLIDASKPIVPDGPQAIDGTGDGNGTGSNTSSGTGSS